MRGVEANSARSSLHKESKVLRAIEWTNWDKILIADRGV